MAAAWAGSMVRQPQVGRTPTGLAGRQTNGGQDRGCLALYTGVADLRIEISLFGPGRTMEDPLDFGPSLDSVLLRDACHG